MLDDYSSKVAAYQARVDDLQARIPGWLDWAAVILTVFFVWLGFSQVGLFVLGWKFYKGEDLLARWQTQ